MKQEIFFFFSRIALKQTLLTLSVLYELNLFFTYENNRIRKFNTTLKSKQWSQNYLYVSLKFLKKKNPEE